MLEQITCNSSKSHNKFTYNIAFAEELNINGHNDCPTVADSDTDSVFTVFAVFTVLTVFATCRQCKLQSTPDVGVAKDEWSNLTCVIIPVQETHVSKLLFRLYTNSSGSCNTKPLSQYYIFNSFNICPSTTLSTSVLALQFQQLS